MSNLLNTIDGRDAVREAILDVLRRRIRRYFDQNTVEMFDNWLDNGKPVPGLPEMAEVVKQLNDDHDQEILDLRELLDYYAGGGGPVPPHAATHQNGGADQISVAGLVGLLATAQTPTAHASSHNAGGGDALAIDAAAATGSLRTIGTGALQACAGNDARLSDARTPTAHASSHQSGGGDAIKLDDLSSPDDNTDLNASSAKHGLLPKLSNVVTEFLTGQGTWATPAGAGALYAEMYMNNNATAQVLETANTPILTRHWTTGSLNGFTFVAGSTGAITAYSNYGGTVPGTVRAAATAHGLSTGDIVSIRGTTNYNGVFQITKISNDAFYFYDTWVADDGASDFDKGAYLLAGASAAGTYHLSYCITYKGNIFITGDLTAQAYINATACNKCRSMSYSNNGAEAHEMTGQSIVTIAASDRVSLAVLGTNAALDPTIQFGDLQLRKL